MSALASRYTIMAVLGVALVGCTKHGSITENITEQLGSDVTQVNIGSIGDFAWDDVFVFGPYYPKDGICKTLKIVDSECFAAGIRDVEEYEFYCSCNARGVEDRDFSSHGWQLRSKLFGKGYC